MEAVSYQLKNVILGAVGSGWLQQVGPWPSRLPFVRQDLEHEMQPLRIRWGLVLLLAIVLVLVMGEFGPVASAIAAQP